MNEAKKSEYIINSLHSEKYILASKLELDEDLKVPVAVLST